MNPNVFLNLHSTDELHIWHYLPQSDTAIALELKDIPEGRTIVIANGADHWLKISGKIGKNVIIITQGAVDLTTVSTIAEGVKIFNSNENKLKLLSKHKEHIRLFVKSAKKITKHINALIHHQEQHTLPQITINKRPVDKITIHDDYTPEDKQRIADLLQQPKQNIQHHPAMQAAIDRLRHALKNCAKQIETGKQPNPFDNTILKKPQFFGLLETLYALEQSSAPQLHLTYLRSMGLGKTLEFSVLLRYFLDNGNSAQKAILVVPSRELAKQAKKELIYGAGFTSQKIVNFSAKNADKLASARIIIMTTSMFERIKVDAIQLQNSSHPFHGVSYLIYDEAHHVLGEKTSKQIEKLNALLTANPKQPPVVSGYWTATDSYGNTKHSGPPSVSEFTKHLMKKIHHPWYPITPITRETAIKLGYLASVKGCLVKPAISAETLTKLKKLCEEKRLDDEALESLTEAAQIYHAIIDLYLNSYEPETGRRFLGQQGVIFAQSIARVEEIAKLFNQSISATSNHPLISIAREIYVKNAREYHQHKAQRYQQKLAKCHNKQQKSALTKKYAPYLSEFNETQVRQEFIISAAVTGKLSPKKRKAVLHKMKLGGVLVAVADKVLKEGVNIPGSTYEVTMSTGEMLLWTTGLRFTTLSLSRSKLGTEQGGGRGERKTPGFYLTDPTRDSTLGIEINIDFGKDYVRTPDLLGDKWRVFSDQYEAYSVDHLALQHLPFEYGAKQKATVSWPVNPSSAENFKLPVKKRIIKNIAQIRKHTITNPSEIKTIANHFTKAFSTPTLEKTTQVIAKEDSATPSKLCVNITVSTSQSTDQNTIHPDELALKNLARALENANPIISYNNTIAEKTIDQTLAFSSSTNLNSTIDVDATINAESAKNDIDLLHNKQQQWHEQLKAKPWNAIVDFILQHHDYNKPFVLTDFDLRASFDQIRSQDDQHTKYLVLSHVQINNCNAQNALMKNLAFYKADLRHNDFSYGYYFNVSFARGFLANSNFAYAIIEQCDFFEARLQDVDLSSSNAILTTFYRANLARANLAYGHFKYINFSYAKLLKANCTLADFSNANLFHANLKCANLSCANLEHTDLRGANLIGANLTNVSLKGALIDEHTKIDLHALTASQKADLRKITTHQSNSNKPYQQTNKNSFAQSKGLFAKHMGSTHSKTSHAIHAHNYPSKTKNTFFKEKKSTPSFNATNKKTNLQYVPKKTS